MDETMARQKVMDHLNSTHKLFDDELVIVDRCTRTVSYGWVFFYTSKKFHETGNIMYAVAGNGPIVVERESGKLTQLPSNNSADKLILDYEKSRSLT